MNREWRVAGGAHQMKNFGTWSHAIMALSRRLIPRAVNVSIRHSLFSIPLLLLASCASGPSAPGDAIQAVHLFGMPVAIRLQQRAGMDAITIRVFATSPKRAHGQIIRMGTLEILAFDGPVPPGQPLPESPKARWTFSPDQLKSYAADSSLGTGYQLTLPWTGPAPTRAHVTVVARYTAPHLSQPIFSGSATIAVASSGPSR